MEMSPAPNPTSRLAAGVQPPDNGNLLEVRDLAKLFPITQGLFKRVIGHVRAVDGVSFTIPRGKTLGLVAMCAGGGMGSATVIELI